MCCCVSPRWPACQSSCLPWSCWVHLLQYHPLQWQGHWQVAVQSYAEVQGKGVSRGRLEATCHADAAPPTKVLLLVPGGEQGGSQEEAGRKRGERGKGTPLRPKEPCLSFQLNMIGGRGEWTGQRGNNFIWSLAYFLRCQISLLRPLNPTKCLA